MTTGWTIDHKVIGLISAFCLSNNQDDSNQFVNLRVPNTKIIARKDSELGSYSAEFPSIWS